VPALRITQDRDFGNPNRRYVWIHARGHAWESGGSWGCVGMMEWLMSEDPRAASLRQMAVVYFVPILDIDNTYHGNGGKFGLPQDHNRDWSNDPHFAEVRGAQERIAALHATGRYELALDFHCPGPTDYQPYYYTPNRDALTPQGKDSLDSFLAASAVDINGPLVLDSPSRNVPVGSAGFVGWREVFNSWASFHADAGDEFAVSLEIPWNTEHSTKEGYMHVGMQQGLGIERFLRSTAE